MERNKPTIVPLILCGGEGVRLVPLSSPERPKPFLKIFEGQSLLQQTVQRCRHPLCAAPVIACQSKHLPLVMEQVKPTSCVLEPVPCNTAPAIIMATHIISRQMPEACILVMPADHYMPRADAFHKAVEQALPSARAGNIVVFGIRPTHAATRFGYIEQGEKMDTGCHAVNQFIEKPSAEAARGLVKKGNNFWNSGMFFFHATSALKVMAQAAPHLYAQCKALTEKVSVTQQPIVLPDSYRQCENIAFDYAVMERTNAIQMLPLEMEWNDVGDWPALLDVLGIKQPPDVDEVTFRQQVVKQLLSQHTRYS